MIAISRNSVPASKEIWVAGYVHTRGGAGTELAHQIDLWQLHGVEVHLVSLPANSAVLSGDDPRRQWCDRRGVHTHAYRPDIFRDKIVVSFCANEFLEKLPEIHAAGKPRLVIWFNCMTWNHRLETHLHREGFIDVYGFQSRFQARKLTPALESAGRPVRALEGYIPYFSLDPNGMHVPLTTGDKPDKPADRFMMGRISRDDAAKFPANLWEMVTRVASPVKKKFFVCGYGANASKKCGDPTQDAFAQKIDRTWWAPTRDSDLVMNQFWPQLDCLLHYWDSFLENYPRALLEAMANGVPIVTNRAGGNPELVQDGVNGFLASTQDEAIFRASQLAFDPELRRHLAEQGQKWLQNNVCNAEKAWQPWSRILEAGN